MSGAAANQMATSYQADHLLSDAGKTEQTEWRNALQDSKDHLPAEIRTDGKSQQKNRSPGSGEAKPQ